MRKWAVLAALGFVATSFVPAQGEGLKVIASARAWGDGPLVSVYGARAVFPKKMIVKVTGREQRVDFDWSVFCEHENDDDFASRHAGRGKRIPFTKELPRIYGNQTQICDISASVSGRKGGWIRMRVLNNVRGD